MPDYEKLASVAQRLIEKNGRDVTVTKRSETPNDSDKPWRGTDTTVVTVECKALFKGLEEALGKDGVVRSFQVAEIAAKSAVLNEEEVDLTGFDLLTDGTVEWSVERIDPLKPGDRTLLWKLYLNQ